MNIIAWSALILLGWPDGSYGFQHAALLLRFPNRFWSISQLQPPSSLRSPTNSHITASHDDGDVEESGLDLFPTLDPALLVADLLALAIACQLMGLTDVLNNPIFWKNGGWFQPIIVAESTLPVFFNRFSLNSCVYVASAASLGAYQREVLQSTNAVLTSAFQSTVAFSILRAALGIGMAYMTSSPELISADLHVVVALFRDCYFVAIATTAGRYIVYTLIYRS